ncbi:hypothetical protein A3J56_02335 [Candidatus Giovannonibacteria bacterium RIFCSPHIGHO2_02_FULL_46_20]|uniref:Peptidase C39-like domain-containing protein n=1 Tax=Candidatus Giovannonibacteria bacterium RIFCSPHIGHO2_02_FULL_46_20 TaxID=1798338 RepID=A0A1F5WG85_9BACT|nr:MAG: hypothetical protein A3J56_02335 [Candidatus Giovannonibacteria bacterium RIFCSPHIGHO2_02_FULL_46_20]
MENKKKQHILLAVPYYSQRLDVKDPFWRSRSCGIAALAMAMEFEQRNHYVFWRVSRPKRPSDPNDRIVRAGAWFARSARAQVETLSESRRGERGKPKDREGFVAGTLQQLIHEGNSIGARDPKYGWIHDGLVGLAKRHGFGKSFRKEWDLRKIKNPSPRQTEQSATNALRHIVVLLQNNLPVLASVKTKEGGHLVLLVGFQNAARRGKTSEGFYYHDPDARSRRGGAFRFISKTQFLKRWKGRIIVVKK